MKKKQTSTGPIVHHINTTNGKLLIAMMGQRAVKGKAHLEEIKETMANEISPSIRIDRSKQK